MTALRQIAPGPEVLGYQSLQGRALDFLRSVKRAAGTVRPEHARVEEVELGMGCQLPFGPSGEHVQPEPLQQILKDLKHRPSQNTSYTTGSIAKWLTNYGRKINNLSLLNVDPEMIEFGTNVAMTLSQAGQVLTTGNIQGSIAARNTGGNPYYYNGDYANGWGYRGSTYRNRADARVTTAERANVKANVRGQSAQMTRQVLSGIDALAAEIRVKMVQKYQLDF